MIGRAVEILQRGGLVAFPTETVYGLGADARNPEAVAKIFAAKGRPATNPLIVHVHSAAVARRYVRDWPTAAEALTNVFWPGPLTLVLNKAAEINEAVAAGGDTVGIRIPEHPMALELLRAFDGPLAAPSANRSNRVSPTTAEHVRQELGDAVSLILDGGPCRVGIESTVLDMTTTPPTLLRPGGVSQLQIEAIIGPIQTRAVALDSSQTATSPGQQAVHYSPTTPTYWFESGESVPADAGSICLTLTPEAEAKSSRFVSMPRTAQSYARELYAALRRADAAKASRIYVELPPDRPEWAAVLDRLRRAAKPLKNLR